MGLDFGTTTTLVAVRVDNEEPRLIPLGARTEWMPSYYWRREDGFELVGEEASNARGLHSVKLRLRDDRAADDTFGALPSEITLKIIEEALGRALRSLRAERLVPADAVLLEVAANVGCSAGWNLETRTLLRNIAQDAGLNVNMANLIEEPVAAAFAVLATGASGSGRVLVIDAGGGTLDACVLRVEGAHERFRLFASGGRDDLGGDRYTAKIVERLHSALAESLGEDVDALTLDRPTAELIWQLAEAAKLQLSTRPIALVTLPAMRGAETVTVSLDRAWFEQETRQLIRNSVAAVQDVYRVSRMVLDRGMTAGDQPGTVYLQTIPEVRKVHELTLRNDALQHLDAVYLVGGASQMPALRKAFSAIFGELLVDPSVYGLAPETAIALGLARHRDIDALDFGYPNWAIEAAFTTPDGPVTRPLYDPFAPLFELGFNTTFLYHARTTVPAGSTSIQIRFRRVSPGEGVQWPVVSLPVGSAELELELSLLGDVRIRARNGTGLVEDLYRTRPAAPWKDGVATHPGWLPAAKPNVVPIPTWDPANDGPG
jgi:molecular chaperone DnaK (HSP70)